MDMISHNDMMIEIFHRLPAKSLFRFKCVSKNWLSLISHPSFPLNHSFHQPPPDSSISAFFLQSHLHHHDFPPEFAPVDKPNCGVPDPSLSFLGRGFSIMDSCNGLLLCRRGWGRDTTFCVCNPTTMEYVLLPQPSHNRFIYSICIAFDPSKSPHYKLVSLSDTKHVHVDIYSSQTGLWRSSVKYFHEPYLVLYEKGVLWNGALHWTGADESSLSFHVETESFRAFKLPPKPKGSTSRKCNYFGESNGHLYLIETYNIYMNKLTSEFDIWEMERDYSQWSFRYHVKLDAMVKAYPEMLVLDNIFYPNGEIVPEDPPYFTSFTVLHLNHQERGEEVLWIHIPQKIVKYQVKDGTFSDYCDLPHQTYNDFRFSRYTWQDVHAFSNTFSSIQSSSSC